MGLHHPQALDFAGYAERFIGTHYRWGGQNPIAGFDCSGLVVECLRAFDFVPSDYDDTAQGIYDLMVKRGAPVIESRGSLVFFGKDLTSIKHVGIVVGHDLMIEAGGGGPLTKTKEDAQLQGAFVRYRPINMRTDNSWAIKPKY